MISKLFYIIFYQPLYNGLVFLVNFLPSHDLGLAIVVLTIVIRIILFPLSHKSSITQLKIKKIEPEILKIKEKFKKDRQEQTRRILEIYQKHGISPFSGFLMVLIQIPILIALYKLLFKGVSFRDNMLYSFVSLPQIINFKFLGLIDISKQNYLLALAAALSQFIQIQLAFPRSSSGNFSGSLRKDFQKTLSFQMKYIMPIFIFFIALKFASGLALYWTISNIFAILHEVIVLREVKKEYG